MNPKTDLPCDCGTIAFEMSGPNSAYSLSDNSFWINEHLAMYFCPFCGGKLPDDSKPIYAPYLTPDERGRLEELIAGINSPEEAIARLGPPDYDEPMLTYYTEGNAMPYMVSGIDGEEIPDDFVLDESVVPTRNMEFYNLSKTGIIEFYFDGGRLTECRIIPKCLPPRHLEEGEIV